MVPERLWRRQRRFRRADVGGRAQCRLFRFEPRLARLASAGSHDAVAAGVGIFVIVVAVFSAILTALYAFQQEDWRTLLSFSSAENASIAVAMLGAALLFREARHAGLAESRLGRVACCTWLATRSPRGGLFLAADGVYRATGRYDIPQTALLRRSSWLFGVGALFAAMSLAAMPPQAGFVSEWYVFQTVFQGFRLDTLGRSACDGTRRRRPCADRRDRFCDLCQVFGVGLARTLGAQFPADRALIRIRGRPAGHRCAGVGGRHAVLARRTAGSGHWRIWNAGRARDA